MIEFTQHIPSWASGFTPEIYKCKTLKSLLSKNRSILKKYKLFDDNFVFACGDPNMFMLSNTERKEWYVLGYVSGIDLSEHLPRYNEVYKGNSSDFAVFTPGKTHQEA